MWERPYLFVDRIDAARQLAPRLAGYGGKHALILAIPRGAVPMAREIAQQLGGELNIVLVRKIGAPFSAEYAVAAVDETGWTYVSPFAEAAGAGKDYIEEEKTRQIEVKKQRRAQYTPYRRLPDPAGRSVIVVDDGLATGATMIAALHAVRAKNPAELICAVPVASPDSLEKIAPLADKVICLHAPEGFMSVGQFYRYFPHVAGGGGGRARGAAGGPAGGPADGAAGRAR